MAARARRAVAVAVLHLLLLTASQLAAPALSAMAPPAAPLPGSADPRCHASPPRRGGRRRARSMGGFPRPAIDLSDAVFAAVMDDAMATRLDPPFDPYASSVNFLLASYILPHITASAALQASMLAVEAGQDAVIRMMLYERSDEVVAPYRGRTVAEFTRRISEWRNAASRCGAKDEGVKVLDRRQGAERRTVSNILGAGDDSLGFARTPAEVLRILYGSGNEQVPGGFLPRGGNGTIARGFFQLA
uniref:rRNA N-glycosidase n=1 Tax=Oryza barthii TaxID=65489 RepID=A0A0D3G3B8_9ORYZ